MNNFKLNETAESSYKIGVDEIEGLKNAMRELMQPVRAALKNNIYWSDVELNEAPYKSYDGFIPHAHNCGGVEIFEVIPECESDDFGYLEFGERDCETYECPEDECLCDQDGGLDAALKIFFKFEGLDSDGVGSFYLVLHGGNNDAPYFRQSNDVMECEFEASNINELNKNASKHIEKMIKLIKKGA